MDDVYIVYVRGSTQVEWHWEKKCTDYPVSDIECMISTVPVSVKYLCVQCQDLSADLVNDSQKTGYK